MNGPERPPTVGQAHQHLAGTMSVAVLCLAAGAAAAQPAPEPALPAVSERLAWRFEPSIGLRETFTTNLRLSESGMKEAVTEVTPQLRMQRFSGPVQGSLDYALTARLFARNSDENSFQHALTATGRAELVPRWAFLDASARIARQRAGTLSSATSDTALLDSRSSEVATLQVSPSVQGYLGSWADYQGRLSWTATRTKDSPADSYTNSAQLRLAAPGSAVGHLGWTLDLTHQASRFLDGDRTDQDQANATLIYGFSPELRLSLRAGQERSDGVRAQSVSDNSWGAGLRWTPSPLTSLEVIGDERYFGHSHSIQFQYRMPRSLWSYVDTRDVSTDAGAVGNALGTVFDALNGALPADMPQAQRTAVIDQYLQSRGLSPTALAGGGFLTTGASLQRRQNLTVGFSGVRTTLLLSIYRSRADSLNPLRSILPDLPPGAGSRQQGISVNISHRLTPLSSVSLDASHSQSESTNTAVTTASSVRSLTGTWSRQLAQGASLSVAARRTLSQGPGDVYNESALIANILKRF